MRQSLIPSACTLLALALITGVLVVSATGGMGASISATDLSVYPWLYLRDGQLATAGVETVSLIALGDVMLGRGVAETADPLGGVSQWLHQADLVIGNLESAIVGDDIALPPTPEAGPQPVILKAPLAAPNALRQAGFDILSLANDHTLDYGSAGLAETDARLRQAGLLTVGAGASIEAAYRPLIVEVKGIRLAFLAFNLIGSPQPVDTAGWARADWDESLSTQAIAQAQAHADAVVVSIHWDDEYLPYPSPAQQRIAQIVLDAGADLVIGHHPHVVQTTQITGTGFIVYSLGDFVFDQERAETKQGLALRVLFDTQGLWGVQALPESAGHRPHLLSLKDADALLAHAQPPPLRIGFVCDREICRPAEVPQTPVEGLFWAGEIDLTGDGVPEKIRRVAERVIVYQEGKEVWQSPPAWRVVDAALGDPNDDGRFEIMLAIWQADADGIEWSQPYIVGHRGGEYRLLWGGRAVFDPIQEIEVGDVDGDGTEELVVLETRHTSGKQAVSIWRWAGWSFSLVWRIEEGHYRGLALHVEEPGQPVLFSVAVAP